MTLSKHIYEVSLLTGFLGAIYLYVFAFDDFSETALVRVSYLWVAAIIFGSHGIIGTEVKHLLDEEKAEKTKEAVKLWRETEDRSFSSKLSTVLLWSYHGALLLGHGRKPLLTAVIATAAWILALSFFFEAIFPAL